MIDVILNAVKILVSEDARKSASSLIELVRRSPEWQKDMCVLEARVSRSASEQAHLLRYLTVEKMQALEYAEGTVSAFQYCFNEISANAFEHGCGLDRNARISIVVDITREYVALTVINSRGMKFDLQKSLDQQSAKLSQNPALRRGRGLLTIYESADALIGLENHDGIKAVFYKPVVQLKTHTVGGLTIISLLAGKMNPSVNRRIMRAAQTSPSDSLIIWLPGVPPTAVLSQMLDLYAIYQQLNKLMVVLLDRHWGYSFNLNLLPQSMIAHTWEDALQKIGRPDLQKQVAKLIGK
jgi:anti-sigma regulatory factor (Ser/Thr protein kinase)